MKSPAAASGRLRLASGIGPQTGPTPCGAADADLWFAESPADLALAKEMCARCPVRAACLAGALARGEPWGVWGGEIFQNGSIIAVKRARGRPPKRRTAA